MQPLIPPTPLDTLRLSRLEAARLLVTLERRADHYSDVVPGVSHRYWKKIVAELQHPGGGSVRAYSVRARCIGRFGVAFLHGGYIHPGTPCATHLLTTHGGQDRICGEVASCRHVDGVIHDVVVRFDEKVACELYAPKPTRPHVLLVEDDPLIAQLVTFHLTHLNATVQHAISAGDAIEATLNGAFDMVLMDLSLPDTDGFEATAILRSKGYSGVIVAFTSETAPQYLTRYLQAGFDQCLSKPYEPDALDTLLASLRQEPLYSRYHNESAMTGLINEFVGQLPELVAALAAAHNDEIDTRAAVRSIKEQGTLFGFDRLSESADRVEAALDNGERADAVISNLHDLVRLCKLVRGRQPA